MSSSSSTSTAISSLVGKCNITTAVAVAGLGLLALGVRSLFRYRSFAAGRLSRPRSSLPFDTVDGASPRSSVANQFYAPDDVKFISLSNGTVRYVLRGPNNGGRVIVMVHGFSIAMEIWKQQSDHLVDRGHTVLCFDNYGRGWSDAPDLPSHASLYTSQLAELLFALNINTPVDLMGVSMGGAIVTEFAALYPAKVARLVLVCPAGQTIGPLPAFAGLVHLPIIGPMLFKSAINKMHKSTSFVSWQKAEGDQYDAWGAFAMQGKNDHAGFMRSLYRTVVDFPMHDQSANYARIAAHSASSPTPMPILILWGEQDGLCLYSNGDKLHAMLPSSQFVSIIDAKHNMIVERPDVINSVLAAYFDDHTRLLPKRVMNSVDEKQEILKKKD